VGSMHWLIVIPFYFFGALTLLLALMLLCRLVRVSPPVNSLVMVAVFASLALFIAGFALDLISLHYLSGVRLLILGLASFALAAIDATLQTWLPLSLDQELDAL
jgi:hypothetical protein